MTNNYEDYVVDTYILLGYWGLSYLPEGIFFSAPAI